MARYTEGSRTSIDAAVDEWSVRCLLGDKSLTQADLPEVWSLERLTDLNVRFNDNPLVGRDGGGSFATKWQQQLADADDRTRLLAAEVVLVHFLFASSVTRRGKLAVIEQTLEGTSYELDPTIQPVLALSERIGHPGIGFNTRRDLQLGYLMDFALRLKSLDDDQRAEVLDDPWKLRDFADDTSVPVREMRHILLHLLRPDEFERISSSTHKREIASSFAALLPEDPPADLDERLYAIHRQLTEYLPGGNTGAKRQVDYYHPPLHRVWESTAGGEGEGVGDLESLLWKKQLIFYGPPGTSKTYQARRLAETLIRREGLRRWGPKAYFEHADEVDQLVKHNIVAVQLHPGFGYPEFVRGLRLEGERTVYRPGLLPSVVERVGNQPLPQDLGPLPVVLILDEINRTDLSAMLGEAFSLLESGQRDRPMSLPGVNANDTPDTLTIPADLFVIGTMNQIDQSVETLDFALRRRFLWRECPFERDTLLAIIADRWVADTPQRFQLDDALEQLNRFADRAQAVNEAIGDSTELGVEYQIGHTYFADITFFLGTWLSGRKQRPANGTYLWTGNGRPQQPLVDLWDRSLKPLLEQYLAGSDLRADQLRQLASAYFDR